MPTGRKTPTQTQTQTGAVLGVPASIPGRVVTIHTYIFLFFFFFNNRCIYSQLSSAIYNIWFLLGKFLWTLICNNRLHSCRLKEKQLMDNRHQTHRKNRKNKKKQKKHKKTNNIIYIQVYMSHRRHPKTYRDSLFAEVLNSPLYYQPVFRFPFECI